MDILAYAIAGGVPVIFLALLLHYTEAKARKIFSTEEYKTYMNNEEI